jgi:hypothetical protein
LEEHFAPIIMVACSLLHAGFLLGLPFNLEDGGDMFLQSASLL